MILHVLKLSKFQIQIIKIILQMLIICKIILQNLNLYLN